MIDANEMVALIESCRHEMQAMLPADEFASLSSKTRQDYRQLGRTLLQRARYAEGGVAEVMTATQRPTTYYKRLAALRYCLYADLVEQLKSLHSALSARPVDRLQVMAIQAQLQQQRAFLREFDMAGKAAIPASAASVPASGKPCAASPATGASNCISALRKASMPMRFWSPR